MRTFTLLPAYGRHYETKEEFQKEWDDGKDFRICGGPYCSIRDVAMMKNTGVGQLQFCNSPIGVPYLTITL